MTETPRRIVRVALAVALGIVGCDGDDVLNVDDQVRNTNSTASDAFSFEVDATGQSGFRLEGINGSVSITGVSGTESFLVDGVRRVGSESVQDALAQLDLLEVAVTVQAGEILVRTMQPQNTGGRNFVVEYDLTIPRRLEGSIVNVNGSVAVDSIDNTLSVINANGAVTLDEIVGSTSVQLVNGEIDSEVTLPIDGTIDLRTVNGNIILAIPDNTSAALSASVLNGNISVSLALQNPVTTPNSLSGALGPGEGAITLTTVNGNITVSGF